jgi:glucose/arabinose dehydrogenase
LALVATSGPVGARTDLAVTTEVVIDAPSPLTFMTHAPGDMERLFIAEREGRIRIVMNGELLETPFLDISSLVSSGGPEHAFSALAFHPDYQNNRRFFVSYTDLAGDGVVARLTATADPNLADPKSLAVLLTIEQPGPTHNVGWVGFGPDGYLYIGSGDGGGKTDGRFSQDLSSLLGKILRIDVDGPDPYGIPADNPFVGQEGRDEIWALGLRNPWRCGFDRQTGDLWIGDVGQGSWEEVNLQPAGTGGLNYGWNCREGSSCHTPAHGCTCEQPGLTDPVYEYDHSAGCAVIGGYPYRGSAIGKLTGLYVFGDFCAGRVWAFDPVTDEATELLDNIPSIASFGEDHDGELYILTPSHLRKIVVAPPVDCNGNNIPDDQDIADGTSDDCNENGIPDECEPDCNENGIADECDIADGTSQDTNNNGIPDECDAEGDLDGDGVVGINDLLLLLAAWGACPAPPADCPADLNGDGTVGITDLLRLLASWG